MESTIFITLKYKSILTKCKLNDYSTFTMIILHDSNIYFSVVSYVCFVGKLHVFMCEDMYVAD